ncbi:MAG: hypothetical protein GF355_16630 [Candidatus Eisenbacteria bacterium]|nr:hypothetical protein [Candidatus Eisenbacteria bacterium]
MKRECYSIEELSVLLDVAPEDSRLVHIHNCVRCRNLLESVRAFRSGIQDAPEAELEDAQGRMRAALARAMNDEAQQPSLPRAAPPLWTRMQRALSGGGWWKPALGAAAAVAVILTMTELTGRDPSTPSGTIRGDGAAATPELAPAPPRFTPDGGVMLSWEPSPQADAYRVVFSDLGLAEIEAYEADPQASLSLQANDLQSLAPAGAQILWRVVALKDGVEVGASPTATLSLPRTSGGSVSPDADG